MRRHHLERLIFCIAVIAASVMLEVNGAGRVCVPGFRDRPLPESCPSWTLFKTPCPGCGLTRSFIHLAHGDVAASLARHRIGVLLFALVAVQIPYRVLALRHPHRNLVEPSIARAISLLLLGLLFGNWIVERAWEAWGKG